jgi:hypothetical protein
MFEVTLLLKEVRADEPLARFCLPLEAFPLFVAKSLTEAVRLTDTFKNVRLPNNTIKQGK